MQPATREKILAELYKTWKKDTLPFTKKMDASQVFYFVRLINPEIRIVAKHDRTATVPEALHPLKESGAFLKHAQVEMWLNTTLQG
jgi:hypothetical protein